MDLPYRVECSAYAGQIPLGPGEVVTADRVEDVAAATAIVVDRCQSRYPDQVGVSFVTRASPLRGRELIWYIRRQKASEVDRLLREVEAR